MLQDIQEFGFWVAMLALFLMVLVAPALPLTLPLALFLALPLRFPWPFPWPLWFYCTFCLGTLMTVMACDCMWIGPRKHIKTFRRCDRRFSTCRSTRALESWAKRSPWGLTTVLTFSLHFWSCSYYWAQWLFSCSVIALSRSFAILPAMAVVWLSRILIARWCIGLFGLPRVAA